MISQNPEASRSDVRSEVDYETNVLSEVWLEAFASRLGIDVDQVYATAQDLIDKEKSRQFADDPVPASPSDITGAHVRSADPAARATATCNRAGVRSFSGAAVS